MKMSLTLDFSEKCAALRNTLELRLSGLIGTASDPDTQKIRIIGFSSENRLHCQFEVSAVTIYSMYLRLMCRCHEIWEP